MSIHPYIFNFQSHGLSRTVANPSIKSKYFSTCRCIKRVHVLDALKALAESLLSISAAQKAIALQNQLNRNYAYDMCANSGRTKWASNQRGQSAWQDGGKEGREEGKKVCQDFRFLICCLSLFFGKSNFGFALALKMFQT